MKNYSLFLMTVALFTFYACDKKNPCPDNIDGGKQLLNFPSKQFFPYPKQTVTIILKNAKNDSFKIKTDNQQYDVIKLNDTLLCGDGIDPFMSQFQFHTSENIRHVWAGNTSNTTVNVLVQLFVENARVKDSAYYDKLSVRTTAGSVTSGLDFITDTRGKTIAKEYTDLINKYRFVADTTWNNKNFKNVYYSVDNKINQTAIFYNKQFGVVGIRIVDEMWVFDRLE
jgi:hypothetical protein